MKIILAILVILLSKNVFSNELSDCQIKFTGENTLVKDVIFAFDCLQYRVQELERIYKSERLKSCFKPKLMYPERVQVKGWNDISLRLSGQNNCDYPLRIYVALNVVSDHVRIETSRRDSECPNIKNRECWQSTVLHEGIVNWEIDTPNLVVLKNILSESENLQIHWRIYNAETRKLKIL